MMNVKTFQCNPLQENCFVVSDDESKEAVVIDCGAFYDAERRALAAYINDNELHLRHVLCTHAHFDHVFGLDTLCAEFGVAPRLHAADVVIYDAFSQQMRLFLGSDYGLRLPPLGKLLADGELIGFGQHRLRVMHTPGHSPGSAVFYDEAEKVLFSGDTLFRMGVGRTDLQGRSWQQWMQSLHDVLAPLPPDVKVYPGHGPATTIGEEVRMNPYFRD